ncbi:site-specific integrase [Candidatus Woesearchaeota archaeon]|nr:site-specific integrase [Candidatus Woesearchaeota archaeon]
MSNGRNFSTILKTGFEINKDSWNAKQGLPKTSDAQSKNIRKKLQDLEELIESNYTNDITKNIEIGKDWLQSIINNFHGSDKEIDLDKIEVFIDHLNKQPSTTIEIKIKHNTLLKKLLKYQKFAKKEILISRLDTKEIEKILSYFINVLGYSPNTVRKDFGFIKTVLNKALLHDLKPHLNIANIKPPKGKVYKVFLSKSELEDIKKVNLAYEYQENARDWLVIGCFTGQRVSDVLNWQDSNILIKNNVRYLNFIQKKTKKNMLIPIHPEVEKVLEKRDGSFPRKISDQKFNDYIKTVCKNAGITQEIKGAKINPKTNRKEMGEFPKYELVTSHIMRRSFATNFYGEIPTSHLKFITGHSTERQLLEYIGKADISQAEEIAKLWSN